MVSEMVHLTNKNGWLTEEGIVDVEVLSGVPLGSVFGPSLFLIYISDMDDNMTISVLKFEDDTNMFRKVKMQHKQQLQNDLDNVVVKWFEK